MKPWDEAMATKAAKAMKIFISMAVILVGVDTSMAVAVILVGAPRRGRCTQLMLVKRERQLLYVAVARSWLREQRSTIVHEQLLQWRWG